MCCSHVVGLKRYYAPMFRSGAPHRGLHQLIYVVISLSTWNTSYSNVLPTRLDGVFNQIQVARRRWTRTDRRSMTGVPVRDSFGSPISTTSTVSTKLGFVGAYVFPSNQTPPSETRSEGRRRSGLQSVAVAAAFDQAGRRQRVRTESTLSVTDESRFSYSPALPALEFFTSVLYPRLACC